MADINARPTDEAWGLAIPGKGRREKWRLLMTGLADINARPTDETAAMILQHTKKEKMAFLGCDNIATHKTRKKKWRLNN